MKVDWINLQNKSDKRGSIVITEAQKNIPFDIKRVYCLYNMNYEARGFHAHKELIQVMVCLVGSCDVLMDDGKSKVTVHVSPNNQGLLIPPMVWHEMSNFSEGCVLMVLASEWYSEKDYIRDYQTFSDSIYQKNTGGQLISAHMKLRLVELLDASYIYQLRQDQGRNRYIHKVPDGVEHQIAWLKEYKAREAQQKDFYFIIEDHNGNKCGVVRVYDLTEKSFCWGSWIVEKDAPIYTALESALLAYKFGFELLGYDQSHFDVRKGNEKVVTFNQQLGAKVVDEDNISYHLSYDKSSFQNVKHKYHKFLHPK